MNTTIENVINESVDRINKRLFEINFILNANPLSEICKIRMEAQELLNGNKTIEQRMSDGFISKIKALSIREKDQFELAEKQKDSIKLIDEKIKLESELADIQRELFYMERRK